MKITKSSNKNNTITLKVMEASTSNYKKTEGEAPAKNQNKTLWARLDDKELAKAKEFGAYTHEITDDETGETYEQLVAKFNANPVHVSETGQAYDLTDSVTSLAPNFTMKGFDLELSKTKIAVSATMEREIVRVRAIRSYEDTELEFSERQFFGETVAQLESNNLMIEE